MVQKSFMKCPGIRSIHHRAVGRHFISTLEFQSGTFGKIVTLSWTKTSDQCRFEFRGVALHFVSFGVYPGRAGTSI